MNAQPPCALDGFPPQISGNTRLLKIRREADHSPGLREAEDWFDEG